MTQSIVNVLDGEEMLKVKEVTSFLKISRSTLYRMIKDDKLTPYKVGIRGTRFKKSDVQNYLKHQALNEKKD